MGVAPHPPPDADATGAFAEEATLEPWGEVEPGLLPLLERVHRAHREVQIALEWASRQSLAVSIYFMDFPEERLNRNTGRGYTFKRAKRAWEAKLTSMEEQVRPFAVPPAFPPDGYWSKRVIKDVEKWASAAVDALTAARVGSSDTREARLQRYKAALAQHRRQLELRGATCACAHARRTRWTHRQRDEIINLR